MPKQNELENGNPLGNRRTRSGDSKKLSKSPKRKVVSREVGEESKNNNSTLTSNNLPMGRARSQSEKASNLLIQEMDEIDVQFQNPNNLISVPPDGIEIEVDFTDEGNLFPEDDLDDQDGSEILDYEDNLDDRDLDGGVETQKQRNLEDDVASTAETEITFKKPQTELSTVRPKTIDEMSTDELLEHPAICKLIQAIDGRHDRANQPLNPVCLDQVGKETGTPIKIAEGKVTQNCEHVKSPSDTTIYAPALKQTSPFNHHGLLQPRLNVSHLPTRTFGNTNTNDRISRFVDVIREECDAMPESQPQVRSKVVEVRQSELVGEGSSSHTAQLDRADKYSEDMVVQAEKYHAGVEMP